MLVLYIQAPFAVCRTFTAGWYRPTATFLTPSAAYGLLLNLAGIETRLREEDERHPGDVPISVMHPDLPRVRMALGAIAGRSAESFPRVATVYQQLHNYPVGSSGGDRAATTFGNKYNISPVRRELLVGLQAVVVVDENPDLEARVRQGLAGDLGGARYGLPFLGDNSFLPDRIDPLADMPSAYWYERTDPTAPIRQRATRLTVWIDRADMSQTVSHLFAPVRAPSDQVPDSAWVTLPPEA